MNSPPDDLLATLLAQEQRLVFDRFDHDTAWNLGCRIRAAALALDAPVAVAIFRNGQTWFQTALPGSAADNDSWLRRKAAVVERYGHSSYYIGSKFRAEGKDFDAGSRLDTAHYAAHGGAFPILVRGSGMVGTVAVSGLPQIQDHELVVSQLTAYLGPGDD